MLAQQNLMMVIVITSISAMGTLVGAYMAYLFIRKNKISKNILNFIVALGGGLLFSAIALVLIPEGTKSLSFLWASTWFFIGSIFFMLLDLVIEKNGGRASQILANTMDSIPESLGVGAAFATGGGVGLLLASLVGLQNITEGFNSFNELKTGGISTKKNMWVQFISSLSGPLAGVIGFLFLAGHPEIISGLFMFSAGGILYLIFHDIAPLAHPKGHWIPTLGSVFGFILGLASQAWVTTNSNTLHNLTYISSTSPSEIIQTLNKFECAHFTNGTFTYKPELIVPTLLAGFKYVSSQQDSCPLIIVVNSDKSMQGLNIHNFENQSVRAAKVAEPLAQYFSDKQIIVLFYDESTPNVLYHALSEQVIRKTLHKWGYGTEPNAPKIEAAELFDVVYGFPLPNNIKPVCHDLTPLAKEQQVIQVVDLRNKLINKDGVLFELPDNLKKYEAPKNTR